MKPILKTLCLFFIGNFVLACNEPFTPFEPFHPQMVVYSVLSSQSDSQFVRLYTTYDPPDHDGSKNADENAVLDAVVTISDNSTSYQLHDTILQRADSTRYPSDVHLYYTYSFRPQRNSSFSLNVSSAKYGSVAATTEVPGTGSVSIPNETQAVLNNPFTAYGRWGIGGSVNLSSKAAGYVVRLLLFFNVAGGQEYVLEVPTHIHVISVYYGEYEFTYPQITGRTSQQVQGFAFSRISYGQFIKYLGTYYGPTYERAVFLLIQYDERFFKYYQITNQFSNPHSVRLDQPDYTNIIGGVGVFGSYSVDTLSVPLPQAIMSPG